VIKVRVSNHEETVVEGRAAAMIVWLVEQAALLERSDKVKVEFDCFGPMVKPKLTSIDDYDHLRVRE
jgi:hypothetical protein